MNNTDILVDLDRCIGCWTCSLACKVGNDLPDDDYYLTVRTLGDGAGIDSPAGVWPDLNMTWLPVWNHKCTKCAPRVAEGLNPYCVDCCPCNAISYSDSASKNMSAFKDDGFHSFKLPAWEDSRNDVFYVEKRQ